MLHPNPTQTYRHRKHDPAAGRWHEYEVVGIVEPWPEIPSGDVRTHWYFPQRYRHTGTGELVVLIGCGTKIYAEVNEPHIAYRNTRPDLCDPEWVFCLRQVSEFTDRRFSLIEP
ncbi:hypothetical protein N836_31580 [Leptolyngbya sp. Heron Island J]|uniref:hypothetical protein n=1 Tax=Leptolyngbya sp. Heron Island J TaxID=1385935 RepID=UPI0003B94F3D|nr:hypothetical protein [Leptolyngbya sp. Heron Island J]ESA38483.1 hypothetical protein N836_31580 [Leptolyngbya sp. Heron Island J]